MSQVLDVAGQDDVARGGKDCHVPVHHVRCLAAGQQFSDSPSGGLVDGSDVHAGQCPGQIRLPRAIAPHVGIGRGAGPNRQSVALGDAQQGLDSAIPLINRNQRAGVQNDRHVSLRVGVRPAPPTYGP